MTYNSELQFAKQLAVDCGEMMLDFFNKGVEKIWKSDDTPLTIADTTINSYVIQKIQKFFPGDTIVGEEEVYLTDSTRRWICDPIDGTLPFSHAVPVSTFTIALSVEGTPMVAVIYDPYMRRLWSASKGGGAFLNGKKIHVKNSEIKNSYINVDLLNRNSHKNIATLGTVMDRLQDRGCLPTTLFSSVYAAGLVAMGQATGAVCGSPHVHDAIAAKVIVEEAGGVVTDLYGHDQSYQDTVRGYIISGGSVHQELIDIVKQ